MIIYPKQQILIILNVILVRYKKEIAEINDFMEKLFPNVELRNYIWKHLGFNTYWRK